MLLYIHPKERDGGHRGENPESLDALYPDAVPFATRPAETLVAWSIDFGRGHWLLGEYEKVASDG